MKTIASVMTQNRMARNILKATQEIQSPQGGGVLQVDYSKLPDAEKRYLAFLGIDENMAGRIADQIRTHGVEERGIWGANVGDWTDPQAARTWAAALNKDVDRTIITKGVADNPVWMQNNGWKLVMQFKGFALAAHQRVLIAGLQENPLRLAENLVFASALGMMIGYLKFMERGDTEGANRLLDNPGLWISEGLDRSGILTIPFEVSNTAEKAGNADRHQVRNPGGSAGRRPGRVIVPVCAAQQAGRGPGAICGPVQRPEHDCRTDCQGELYEGRRGLTGPANPRRVIAWRPDGNVWFSQACTGRRD
ncbi:hypothetical protein QW131_14420 [Roseibium salinum]|nr:hypothetical protein [Roseibium salinum]